MEQLRVNKEASEKDFEERLNDAVVQCETWGKRVADLKAENTTMFERLEEFKTVEIDLVGQLDALQAAHNVRINLLNCGMF